jgi:hypothetical protein
MKQMWTGEGLIVRFKLESATEVLGRQRSACL